MNGNKNQAIVFCNTLWFALNFKFEVCNKLTEGYDKLLIIYLRKGPPHSNEKKKILEKKGVIFFEFRDFLLFRIKNFFYGGTKSILLTFTIGPILLGTIPILFNQRRKIVVLEGLGRVFSSNKIFYKVFKIFITLIYKVVFRICYDQIVVLNYIDYSFLLEDSFCPLSKLKIIPGTGIDSKVFNLNNISKYRDNSNSQKNWIAYIGRIDKDKGFYRFIAAATYLIKNNSLKDHKFVVICPEDDIKKLPRDFPENLRKIGIFIYPYVANILVYYCNIKIIVIPTVYSEGLSRVGLEACLLSIPIIGTFNRGIVDIVRNNYNGILLNDSSSYGIAYAVEEIIKNYNFFVKNSEIHSKIINKRYGIDVSLKSLFDIIKS